MKTKFRLCVIAFAAIIAFSMSGCSNGTTESGTPGPETPVAADFTVGNLTQTIGSVTAVTVTPKSGKSGGTITVYYDGSTALPTTAGTYLVTFDVAVAAGWKAVAGLAGGTLTISPPEQVPLDPAAGDFDIGNLTQATGSVTAVTITPKSGKSGGTITVYYDGSTALPATAGTYPVTFDVAAAAGWKAAVGLAGGTLVISKLKDAVTNTSGSATVTYTAAGFDLSSIAEFFTIDANAGARTYTVESGGTGTGTIGADNKTLSVTKSGTFTIGLTTAGTDDYYAGTKVTATLTVNKADGSAVTKPAVSGTPTYNSITVGAVTLAVATGQSIEYAISTTNAASSLTWQAGTTFNGLTSGITYYVYAYSKANDNYNAGEQNISAGIDTVLVLIDQPFNISLADLAPEITSPAIYVVPRGDKHAAAQLTVIEQYDSVTWYYQEQVIANLDNHSGVIFTLSGSDLTLSTSVASILGQHTVTVEAKKGNMLYSTVVRFEVKP